MNGASNAFMYTVHVNMAFNCVFGDKFVMNRMNCVRLIRTLYIDRFLL